jgi:hypothetical protein
VPVIADLNAQRRPVPQIRSRPSIMACRKIC